MLKYSNLQEMRLPNTQRITFEELLSTKCNPKQLFVTNYQYFMYYFFKVLPSSTKEVIIDIEYITLSSEE